MVEAFTQHSNVPSERGRNLIAKALPALVKEHTFWMEKRGKDVTVGGKTYKFNIFKGDVTTPRPESYREDYHLAENITAQKDKEWLWANLGAGAESGFDFSSRWLDTAHSDFSTIRAETIIPVDLNALLCAHERILADFYHASGKTVDTSMTSCNSTGWELNFDTNFQY